jgi:hypothetical protein
MLCQVTDELGLCLIHKNASSSLRAARPMRPVTAAEFVALPRRVALLREPRDRFESTWRDYRRRRDVRLSFGEFAEAAFTRGFPFRTPELLPQADSCGLANRLVRWDFDELAELLGAAVPHLNRTGPEPVTWPERVAARFADVYAADLALWDTGQVPAAPATPPTPLHRY